MLLVEHSPLPAAACGLLVEDSLANVEDSQLPAEVEQSLEDSQLPDEVEPLLKRARF